MRPLRLFTLAVALTTGGVCQVGATPPAGAQSPPPSVSLSMPMCSVAVGGGQVTYVWFAVKAGHKPPMRQDLSGYERRVARTALTPAGQGWLWAWARRYRVFSFARRYKTMRPGSYGAAFVTRLSVRWGRRRVQSVWDDTSRALGPAAAAGALVTWARGVTEDH